MILTTLNEKIKGEAKLGDLNAAVQKLLEEVNRRDDEQRLRTAANQRRADFLRLRDEANRHDTRFSSLDLPGDMDATRRAAHAALSLFAVSGRDDSWALAPLPDCLSPREQDEICEGCYELLLTLAEVEPTPEAGLRRLEEAGQFARPPRRTTCGRRHA